MRLPNRTCSRSAFGDSRFEQFGESEFRGPAPHVGVIERLLRNSQHAQDVASLSLRRSSPALVQIQLREDHVLGRRHGKLARFIPIFQAIPLPARQGLPVVRAILGDEDVDLELS